MSNFRNKAEFSKSLTQNSEILHLLDAINLPEHFAVDFLMSHIQLIFHSHLSLPNNNAPRDFPTKICMLSKYMLVATYPVHSDSLNVIILDIYITYIHHHVLHYVIPKIFIILRNQPAVQWLAAHVQNICLAVNPLNTELHPIYLLALLGAHHFLHVSRIRVKLLTFRRLMSYRSWVRIPSGHGYLSVVSVVCCQVEVSATSWSLVQRSPTDCAASLCVI